MCIRDSTHTHTHHNHHHPFRKDGRCPCPSDASVPSTTHPSTLANANLIPARSVRAEEPRPSTNSWSRFSSLTGTVKTGILGVWLPWQRATVTRQVAGWTWYRCGRTRPFASVRSGVQPPCAIVVCGLWLSIYGPSHPPTGQANCRNGPL